MRRVFFLLVLAPACSWSAFDELADETWVDSTGAAEGIEANEFIGLASPGVTGRNAVFVALGRADDSIGSYAYDVDGARSSDGVVIHAGATQFGNLPLEAQVAGDPYSNIVGVAAVTGEGNIGDTKVAHFEADDIQTIVIQNDFNDETGNMALDGAIVPTGMVYARTDDDGVGTTTTDVALARSNHLALVQDYAATAHTLIGCMPASNGSEIVMTVGAGSFDASDADDELVMVTNDESGTAPSIVILNGSTIAQAWTANGTLLGACFDGTTRVPIARINGPAGDAAFGGKLAIGDFDGDTLTDLAVSSPESDTVTVYMNDGNLGDGLTGVELSPPSDAAGFGAALVAADVDGDGAHDLVVGAPQANVDGEANAGAAYIYRFEGSFELAMTLHDAQPEAQQRFGRSVASVAWDPAGATDRRILVVAGDQEIFTYFRTLLYDDVRQ